MEEFAGSMREIRLDIIVEWKVCIFVGFKNIWRSNITGDSILICISTIRDARVSWTFVVWFSTVTRSVHLSSVYRIKNCGFYSRYWLALLVASSVKSVMIFYVFLFHERACVSRYTREATCVSLKINVTVPPYGEINIIFPWNNIRYFSSHSLMEITHYENIMPLY